MSQSMARRDPGVILHRAGRYYMKWTKMAIRLVPINTRRGRLRVRLLRNLRFHYLYAWITIVISKVLCSLVIRSFIFFMCIPPRGWGGCANLNNFWSKFPKKDICQWSGGASKIFSQYPPLGLVINQESISCKKICWLLQLSFSSIVRSDRYVKFVNIWIHTKYLPIEKSLPSAKCLATAKNLAFTTILVID